MDPNIKATFLHFFFIESAVYDRTRAREGRESRDIASDIWSVKRQIREMQFCIRVLRSYLR